MRDENNYYLIGEVTENLCTTAPRALTTLLSTSYKILS